MATTIIDLTLPHYHGLRGVEIEPNTSRAVEGFNTTLLHLYSHAGTHLDAPRHFLDDGPTLEQIDLQKCIGPAVVVDLSHKEPDSLISVADLEKSAEQIGPRARVLLHTGWDTHAELPDYRTNFPRISPELAAWFAQRKIWLVGMEMPSVAKIADRQELTIVHQTLLRAGIVIVECLCNLHLLPPEVFLIAMPLKIQAGDGSPIRAAALVEQP